ncbi:hypothetical protein GGP97_001770 [Salinibacter ruber]|nr:hypothetical protein [Salinibacter ruber]
MDAVDSCDIYLAILGERGGWAAPSGRLVVEEEFDRARSSNLRPLVFLQDIERDDDAERLARKMSDYITGRFRVEFDTPEELENEVRRALEPVLDSHKSDRMDMASLQRESEEPYQFRNDASLRFLLAPVRDEEVVSPVDLEADAFEDLVHCIAHDRDSRLLEYEKSKQTAIEGNALVIYQQLPGRGRGGEDVRIEIRESGLVAIDLNISSRARADDTTGMAAMTISLEEVRSLLEPCFRFSSGLYDEIDEYERYHEFAYNVTLVVGNRAVEEKKNPNRSSVQVPMGRSRDEAFTAFDEPRTISRPDLRDPSDEIERVTTLMRRKGSQS